MMRCIRWFFGAGEPVDHSPYFSGRCVHTCRKCGTRFIVNWPGNGTAKGASTVKCPECATIQTISNDPRNTPEPLIVEWEES